VFLKDPKLSGIEIHSKDRYEKFSEAELQKFLNQRGYAKGKMKKSEMVGILCDWDRLELQRIRGARRFVDAAEVNSCSERKNFDSSRTSTLVVDDDDDDDEHQVQRRSVAVNDDDDDDGGDDENDGNNNSKREGHRLVPQQRRSIGGRDDEAHKHAFGSKKGKNKRKNRFVEAEAVADDGSAGDDDDDDCDDNYSIQSQDYLDADTFQCVRDDLFTYENSGGKAVKTLWETFDSECNQLRELAVPIWRIYHEQDLETSLPEVSRHFHMFVELVTAIHESVRNEKVIKDAISAPIPALFRGDVDNILSRKPW